MLHKNDGPALVDSNDGRAVWYRRNKRHRIDGPAVIIYPSKEYYWWLDNEDYSFAEWLERTPVDEEQKFLLKLKYG